jgi:micrococcal nuclease
MFKIILRLIFKLIDQSEYETRRKPTPDARTRRATPPKQSNSQRASSPIGARPFDSETSHAIKHQRILEGPAYVTDGDTITIQKTQVRLFGIDAPELNHPYGKNAKWALVRLCKGHHIRAEVLEEDDYGRTVARCTLPDGRDLSQQMVQDGHALDWPKFSGGKYSPFEVAGIRKKLWLADARQKGRMHVWEKFEAGQRVKNKSEYG